MWGPDAAGYSTLAVTVKELDPLLNAISEGLQMAPGSKLNFMLNPSDNVISLRAESDYLERGRLLATRLKMNMVNPGRLAGALHVRGSLCGRHAHAAALDDGRARRTTACTCCGLSTTRRLAVGQAVAVGACRRDDSTGMRTPVDDGKLPSAVSQRGRNWRISSDRSRSTRRAWWSTTLRCGPTTRCCISTV